MIALGCSLVAAALPAGAASPGTDLAVTAGRITTIAGGMGGPALATRVALTRPCAVTYARGSVYVADSSAIGNGLIRAISARTDRLTTLVGAGILSVGADGDPASGLLPGAPCGVAVDHHGNLLVSASFTGKLNPFSRNRVRVVAATTGSFYGQSMLAGHIYTIAGNGTPGRTGDGGPAAGRRDPAKRRCRGPGRRPRGVRPGR